MTMTIISNQKVDMVKQPPHYQFGIFTANVIIEAVGKTYKSASVFYHVGNALKYLMRAPRKNGLQDLEKASIWQSRCGTQTMTTSTYELSSTINQRYRYNTKGKTPTQINRELRDKGVQGFVIKVGSNKVVMKVLEEHKQSNRECMR